jgi:CRISPR-associated protein Cas1
MNPLLISGFANSISVDKRKLVVSNAIENTRLEFYPHQIKHDSIIIDGHTGSISFDAVRWVAKHNISLTLLNWDGNLLSVTLPKEPISSKLKIKQYEKYLNEKERYKIADKIIEEKVNKSCGLLVTLSDHYKEIKKSDINVIFTREENIYKNTKQKDIKKLMTYEGRIADFYWDCLYEIFNRLYPEFNFQSRNNTLNSHNRNASDEINALLNYGYAILESEIRKDLNSIGFDPSISFLHELADSRASLVYDVQELYRWLVDLSVIQLLEEKKLKKSDFIVTENYHIRLRESTAKALLSKITLNLNKTAEYKGKNYSYEFILFDNVRILANNVIGKTDSIVFNIPVMENQRSDKTELRDRILEITPEERKKLGINKSTLWYMQKHVKEGKKIKVYDKIMNKL